MERACAQVRRNDFRVATGVDVQQGYVVAIPGFEMTGDLSPQIPGGAGDYNSLPHGL